MLSMEWSREIVSWTTTITKDTTIKLPGYKTITNGHLWYGKCSSQFLSVVLYFIDSRSNCCFATSGVACALLYVVIWKNSFCFSSKTEQWLKSMLSSDCEMGQVKKILNLDFGNVFTEMSAISCFGSVLDCRNFLLDGSLFPDPSFCILVCGDFNFWSCRRRTEKKCNEEACIKKETAE